MVINMRTTQRIAAGCLAVGVLFAGWTAYIYITAPVEQLRGVVSYTPPFKYYTRKAGLGLPDNLTLEEMPADLIIATIAQEDSEFPSHHGFVPYRMYTAVEADIFTDKPLRGNSTITQQLVKNIFTGPSRNLYRKYIELIYAIKMERCFTKAEIFTLYANIAQVGPNSYGFKAAAREYFDKNVQQLTDAEAAFIVSILPAPDDFTRWFRKKRVDLIGPMKWRLPMVLRHLFILKEIMFPQGTKVPVVDKNFFTQNILYKHPMLIIYTKQDNERFWAQAKRATGEFVQQKLQEKLYNSLFIVEFCKCLIVSINNTTRTVHV